MARPWRFRAIDWFGIGAGLGLVVLCLVLAVVVVLFGGYLAAGVIAWFVGAGILALIPGNLAP